MPTLTIQHSPEHQFDFQPVLRRLTVGLAKHGIDPNHIMVVLQETHIYFGPVLAPKSAIRILFEFDANREAGWRDETLKLLRSVFMKHFTEQDLFIQMVRVNPNDAWNYALAKVQKRNEE